MAIEVVADDAALAERAAEIICDAAQANPELHLALPSGETPIWTYGEIARQVESGRADFSRATVFAVDEFLGPARATPGTNSAYYKQYLRFPVKALHIPNPAAEQPEAHIRAFADAIRRGGGIDLCVLGLGTNGHIAFNEPGADADSRARVVTLHESSRERHAGSFGSLEQVPERGLTLGVADLMESRAVLVLIEGAHKAAAAREAIVAKPSAAAPASWLQVHPNLTWLLDAAAASQLEPD